MRSSLKRTRAPKKFTPAVQAVLVEQLAAGATKKAAAAAAGISVTTLDDWLELARAKHPRLSRFAHGVAVARRRPHEQRDEELARALGERRARAVAEDRALAARVVRLLEAGATLRGAAKALGIPWDTLRTLVARARRGAEHLADLAAAAQRRARTPMPRTCPHCGRRLASRGER